MVEREEDDGEEFAESEDEGQDGYKMGGYHHVCIGDGFKNNRYIVRSKLGWGHFSTVWLSWDTLEHRYVALKVQKSAQHYTEAALDEITILKEILHGDLENKKCVVKLLDYFRHSGPNGQHLCLVFEYLGDNLLSLIKYYGYKGLPLNMVKEICYHILKGLDYIHRELSLIHTDLKPENILLVSPIDPAKDPYKSGQYSFKKISEKFNQTSNSLTLKDTEKLKYSEVSKGSLVSAVAKERLTSTASKESSNSEAPMYPSKFMDPIKPSVFAAPKVTTAGLTKNQKKKLKKKAKKLVLALANSSKDSELVSQGLEGIKENCSVKEAKCESVAEKDDLSNNVVKENVANVTPLKKMRLSIRRKILAKINLRCKIADFGNSCWTYKHFTNDIQTRQYRAPEVIIGADYSTSVDIWSFACIAFELATGDVLFDPHAGYYHNREEDHLALMMELLGRIPKKVALGGFRSHELFNKNGELKNFRQLCLWPLRRVLMEKYNFKGQLAKDFANFLVPLLDFIPERRPTAAEWLHHPWLNGVSHVSSSPVEMQRNSHIDQAVIVQQVSTEHHPSPDKTENTMTKDNDIHKAEILVSKESEPSLEKIIKCCSEKETSHKARFLTATVVIEGCKSRTSIQMKAEEGNSETVRCKLRGNQLTNEAVANKTTKHFQSNKDGYNVKVKNY
ncbi:hypothetical protein SUGI_0090030 [Cryptomeria japonica]|uniref:uncharacterized protein LOC131045381 n=1 Tax=Cryptomeria japonica TaxID=3369 RepID=UPI002408A07E|nr:uncharacterized protein LOC131045381 [Cryptomeria japonica]XP_057834944.2 uncharacterized protein LOC131045381 [Cryptomeria japonica]GLJ08509.1 hypothetical protein SUGI_0090030 [Cryptomeria japonica]